MNDLVYPRFLAAAEQIHADRVLIVDGEYQATWTQHRDRVLRLTGALRGHLGLERGDRFAILAHNSHCFTELYHAAFHGAGVVNPLNTRLSGDELEFILKDSATRLVFVDGAHYATLTPIARRLGCTVFKLDGTAGRSDYEALISASDPEIDCAPQEDDAVVLMYTGGTTGLPKGVVHTQRAQMLNMYQFQLAFPFDATSTFLMYVPMFHAGALTVSLLAPAVGASTVVQRGFTPAAVIEATERHAVTHYGGVPTMITMLLRDPTFRSERLRSLQWVLCGGAPLSRSLIEEFEVAVPQARIVQGYGMTEAGLFVSVLPVSHRQKPERLASVGLPVLGVEVQIRGRDDGCVRRGEVGEVCIRGGNLLAEYWRRPDETAAALSGGWYHTGDLGCFDDDGYLYIKDRAKDMIISGGENVYSAEVENAIASHPAVAQVAVIGIPHEVWGEAVHAVVVLKPGQVVDSEALIAHTRARIAGYKTPKSIEYRTELPMSPSMKPLKRDLRAPYWPADREPAES